MNFSRNLMLAIWFATGVLNAAELYGRKMEIVRTPAGPATILRDSVVIIDGKTQIYSRYAQLNRTQDYVVLRDGVIINTPEVDVQADSVEYDLQQRRSWLYARFGNKVLVRQESVEIRAPVIEYFFEQGLVRAPEELELNSISQSFFLSGKKGSYSINSRSGTVDSEPILTINGDDGGAVVITAEKMEYVNATDEFRAWGKVRVGAGAGELACDSAVFYVAADSGVAWGKPEVRDSSGVAHGEMVVFFVEQRALRRVAVRGNAEGEYQTEGGEKVRVSGSVLSMSLADGKIETIEVERLFSGQLIRRVRESGSGE
jgi:lipopolysaccharide export system protein LptA